MCTERVWVVEVLEFRLSLFVQGGEEKPRSTWEMFRQARFGSQMRVDENGLIDELFWLNSLRWWDVQPPPVSYATELFEQTEEA
jgi:hypothetical protein